ILHILNKYCTIQQLFHTQATGMGREIVILIRKYSSMQHHKNKLTHIRTGVLFCLMAILVSIIMPYQALAVSTTLTPSPKVTFTFDDGLVSSILAAQTLQQYGFTGTNYIISQCVGVKSPGICAG